MEKKSSKKKKKKIAEVPIIDEAHDWDKFFQEEYNIGYIVGPLSELSAGQKYSTHLFFRGMSKGKEPAQKAAFQENLKPDSNGFSRWHNDWPPKWGVYRVRFISSQRYCHDSESYYVEIIEPVSSLS